MVPQLPGGLALSIFWHKYRLQNAAAMAQAAMCCMRTHLDLPTQAEYARSDMFVIDTQQIERMLKGHYYFPITNTAQIPATDQVVRLLNDYCGVMFGHSGL
jgi:hypothetical protein